MDYAGLDYRNIRYAVNRVLTADERANRLLQDKVPEDEANDGLAVITLNSTYLELVDRWYPVKGFNVWLGAMLSCVVIFLLRTVVWGILYSPPNPEEDWIVWPMLLTLGPILLFFLWGAVWLIRTEAFRYTHYPMRLNRKTRQVHVFRQDGTVLTTAWDDLYIVLANSTMPPLGKTHDIRAHVLADDGVTVEESFTLGYVHMGDANANRRLWAFVRRYMEAPDGVVQTFDHMNETFCLPLDGRKEGWGWSILRAFMTAIRFPLIQLLFCVPYALTAWGRCIAMSTSRQPRWPDEVDAANIVEPNDPYVRSWRNNPSLTPFQVLWPSLCFVLGTAISVWVVTALIGTM